MIKHFWGLVGALTGASVLLGCVTYPYETGFLSCDQRAGYCYQACDNYYGEPGFDRCLADCDAQSNRCFAAAYSPYSSAYGYGSIWYGRYGAWYPQTGYVISSHRYRGANYRAPYAPYSAYRAPRHRPYAEPRIYDRRPDRGERQAPPRADGDSPPQYNGAGRRPADARRPSTPVAPAPAVQPSAPAPAVQPSAPAPPVAQSAPPPARPAYTPPPSYTPPPNRRPQAAPTRPRPRENAGDDIQPEFRDRE